jgi:YHS domain-containing protein
MLRLALLLLLAILLIRALWRLVSGVVDGIAGPQAPGQRSKHAVQMARDPVCGTFVVPGRAVSLTEREGPIYFCSKACRDRYRARTA